MRWVSILHDQGLASAGSCPARLPSLTLEGAFSWLFAVWGIRQRSLKEGSAVGGSGTGRGQARHEGELCQPWKLRIAKVNLPSLPRTYNEPTECKGPHLQRGGTREPGSTLTTCATCTQEQNISKSYFGHLHTEVRTAGPPSQGSCKEVKHHQNHSVLTAPMRGRHHAGITTRLPASLHVGRPPSWLSPRATPVLGTPAGTKPWLWSSPHHLHTLSQASLSFSDTHL